MVKILTALQYDILLLYSQKTDCVVYDLRSISYHQENGYQRNIFLFPIIKRQGGTDGALTGLCMIYTAYQNYLSVLGPC